MTLIEVNPQVVDAVCDWHVATWDWLLATAVPWAVTVTVSTYLILALVLWTAVLLARAGVLGPDRCYR